MRRIVRFCCLGLALLVISDGVWAENVQQSIPVHPVGAIRRPSEPLTGWLQVPPGKGPFPVVILLHGCGGLGNRMPTWTERLIGWGYATLILDSFGARHVTSVCAPAYQPLVTNLDRAGDVMNAAAWLQGVPGIDGKRVGVVGFSHGGGTAVAVTRDEVQRSGPGLIKAAVAYYGPCRDPAAHGTVPLLVLAGEDDTWGFPARTCKSFGVTLRPDQPFEIHTYPGVVHDFDNPRVMPRRMLEGHPAQYDHDAAEDSYQRVRTFLARYL